MTAKEIYRCTSGLLWKKEKKGRAEGIVEGRAEGRAEGVEIGQVKLIINMIKYNMPLETIANSTKVALEKVRQIAKENKLLK